MSVAKNNKKIRVSIKSKKALETHCKWCGKPFKKHHNRQMYCGDECRKYSRQDQKKNFEWKRRRSPHIIKDDYYYGLGSGHLSFHANENFDKEIVKVQNEKKRLGFKNLFF